MRYLARLHSPARRAPAFALLMACLSLSGCSQPHGSFTPSVDPSTLSDNVFLHYLAQTPLVTVDEGQRSVLMLIGITAEWPTSEARRTELIDRGAIKLSWRLDDDRLLDAGTLAHMLLVVCDLPPGLNDQMGRLTGLADRRSALKTCIHEGLLPYSVPHKPVTGGELVTALTRAEERLASTGAADSN